MNKRLYEDIIYNEKEVQRIVLADRWIKFNILAIYDCIYCKLNNFNYSIAIKASNIGHTVMQEPL